MKRLIFIALMLGMDFFIGSFEASSAENKVVVVPLNMSSRGTNWIDLNVHSANLTNGASYSSGSSNLGISLAKSKYRPHFDTSMVIPGNYKADTDIILHILWNTVDTICRIDFRPSVVSVARKGSLPFSGPAASTGLLYQGGDSFNLQGSTSSVVHETQYLLFVPPGYPPQSDLTFAPFDTVHFGFYRATDSIYDTCTADMWINGLYVTYQTQ